MDDIIGKINDVLSDEESRKQLSELLQMFMSGEVNDAESGEECETANEEQTSDMPDFSSILKLTGIMSAYSQNDKNSELLLALKPHLSEEKQKRVEKAVKILKLIAVWNVAKESGAIDELI